MRIHKNDILDDIQVQRMKASKNMGDSTVQCCEIILSWPLCGLYMPILSQCVWSPFQKTIQCVLRMCQGEGDVCVPDEQLTEIVLQCPASFSFCITSLSQKLRLEIENVMSEIENMAEDEEK